MLSPFGHGTLAYCLNMPKARSGLLSIFGFELACRTGIRYRSAVVENRQPMTSDIFLLSEIFCKNERKETGIDRKCYLPTECFS